MAQGNWSGIHIPIITPFKDDYSIDEAGLRRLVDYCIEEQKADGLVPCGTTGESPTLSHEEHHRVIELVIKAAAGRVPVIAGTGSNSTREARSEEHTFELQSLTNLVCRLLLEK